MPLSLAWAWLSDTCLSSSRELSADIAEGEHLGCCMKESQFLRRCGFGENKAKHGSFFFFLFGNSISFISILNFFFYLRYHFPSTAVYTSLLCAPFVKYNLRLLLYALIPPMSQSLVPLGTLRRPALSILLNLSTSSPVPEKQFSVDRNHT